MNPILTDNLSQIDLICRKHRVRELYAFGSVTAHSDVDLLVDFGPVNEAYADNYFEMCYALEDLLGRPVDLLTVRSLKNPVFKARLRSRLQKYPCFK